jgi:MtfA peptidase
MPPDTTYLPGTIQPMPDQVGLVDSARWRDSVWKQSVQLQFDSLDISYRPYEDQQRPSYPLPEGTMFLIVLAVLCLSAYLYIIRPSQRERQQKLVIRPRAPKDDSLQEIQFDQWLSRYNPYYNALSAEHKKRFLHRVQQFMLTKEFRFHSMVGEDYIPVLVSAAAVQLTFGLRNYRMDYFDVIHIMRKEYVLNINQETYYGHVSKNGIHVSWKKFMEGYDDYNDCINLGLHEMAHALQYDAYLGLEDHHDRYFKERLNEYAAEGRPVFRAMRQGLSYVMDEYALENFDEFWAVSVEMFFENPVTFREKLPNLYQEMCELLNQDPAEPGKLLNSELA